MPLTVHNSVGALFIGTTITFVLHGMACSQAIWYFKTYGRDHRVLKGMVGSIWVAESLTFLLVARMGYYYLIGRGIEKDPSKFLLCLPGSELAIQVSSAVVCSLVELYFLLRMYKFTEKKKLAALAFLPFLVGWGFSIAYIAECFVTPCYIKIKNHRPLLVVGCGFRLVTDAIITLTMSFILRRKSVETGQIRTIRIVNSLIIWSISSGVVMWLSTLVFIVAYLTVYNSTIPLAIYWTRAGVFANAILALLNDRERFREMAQESIQLQVDLNTMGTQVSLPPLPQQNRFQRRSEVHDCTHASPPELHFRDPAVFIPPREWEVKN
ncbi:hypothetical protein B0H34DRAFT_707193 [Crassisporium funariophilum]|nr:hypothetical protein B0H34DRAFT_707193 [Crassisporium funariophilum]